MKNNFRHAIQLIYTAVTNGYAIGFFKGNIYKGNAKYVCLPGLNCYSCPGALGSCPIGSLQAVLSSHDKSMSYYVLGLLILFGVTLGRIVCGFLCPFGFVQDLIYKIKSKKLNISKKVDNIFRYFKYVVLILFVVVLPIFVVNDFNMGSPAFCKYICPSGTLFGGVPLLSVNENLRSSIGGLFLWKVSLLAFFLISSIFVYRPFCKYICPLGAFYGLFNSLSLFKLDVDKNTCTNCNACTKNCKMQVEVTKNINSKECIRCLDCKNNCPNGSIKFQSLNKGE